MKWIAVALMYPTAGGTTIGSALILGPPGRVSVVWIGVVAFAAAIVGTIFVAEAK